MSEYLRIATAYVRTSTLVVWCFFFFCLLFYSVIGEDLAREYGAVMGGMLSGESCMALFAYFSACALGGRLTDNIARPWASVLPHYRRKHLQVTAFIAVFFVAIPMFAMAFTGTSHVSPTSVAVIFLTCLAAGLWMANNLILSVLAFIVIFFAGVPTAVSIFLCLLALGALVALARRLLTLNEEMPAYAVARWSGDFYCGRAGIGDFQAVLQTNPRTRAQNFDPQKQWFSNLKQVDSLTGYSERSLWQRLQLWRMGISQTRSSASTAWLFLTTLILIPPMIFMQRWTGSTSPARSVVMIMAVQLMMNPFNLGLFWFMHRERLGYESLRPRTRKEFVQELGLTLACDTILCWLWGVLCMILSAAIWAPELLQARNMLLFISGTAAGQLCAYAMMGMWLLKQRGMMVSVLLAMCPMSVSMLWGNVTMDNHIVVELNIAIISIVAAVSAATIRVAYGRWCRADFD